MNETQAKWKLAEETYVIVCVKSWYGCETQFRANAFMAIGNDFVTGFCYRFIIKSIFIYVASYFQAM